MLKHIYQNKFILKGFVCKYQNLITIFLASERYGSFFQPHGYKIGKRDVPQNCQKIGKILQKALENVQLRLSSMFNHTHKKA